MDAAYPVARFLTFAILQTGTGTGEHKPPGIDSTRSGNILPIFPHLPPVQEATSGTDAGCSGTRWVQ